MTNAATLGTAQGVPRRWGDSKTLVFQLGAVAFDETRESDQCVDLRLHWPAPINLFLLAQGSGAVAGDTVVVDSLIDFGVGSALARGIAIDISSGVPFSLTFPADAMYVAFRVRVSNPAPAPHAVAVRVIAAAAPFTYVRREDVV